MQNRKQQQQRLQVSALAIWFLLASFNFDLCPAASLYESQIIGITFPSAEAQQQVQQQQRHLQQQSQRYRSATPSSIYEQLRLAAGQPRTIDTNVKRTILWKDGQRPGGSFNQRQQALNSELLAAAALWENSTRGGKRLAGGKLHSGLKFQGNAQPALVFTGHGYPNNIMNNYQLLQQQQQQQQQPVYKQQQKKQHHRVSSEEVGLHTPILGPSSTSDYEWKRVENSRWNNLRGMWGKRADTTISGGGGGGASGVNDNVKLMSSLDELDELVDDEKFKELLIELLESGNGGGGGGDTEQRATRLAPTSRSGGASDPISQESKAD